MESKSPQSLLKNDLRKQFKQASRAYINPDVSLQVVSFLKEVLPAQTIVGAYFALPDEPDLQALIDAKSVRLAFPRIEGLELHFYLPVEGSSFEVNEFGVKEPALGAERVSLNKMGAILVPAVAFDRRARRLGRGKGYYDRLLAHYSGLKIGVGSAVQVSQHDLPDEPHDIAMDLVVTDRYVLRRFDS